MALIVLTPPAAEPLSLADLKEHLRVDADDASQDKTIRDIALGARVWVESYTRRRLVSQRLRLLLDRFPSCELILPSPPVRSVESVSFQAGNGELVEMQAGANYVLDLASQPARLTPPYGQSWPVTRLTANCVEIDYTVGYALPITVRAYGSPIDLSYVESTAYTFLPGDVHRPIAIAGAGEDGAMLDTVIASVSSPLNPVAMLRDAAAHFYQNAPALLVNVGSPAEWDLCRLGIKLMVAEGFQRRLGGAPNRGQSAVKDLLYPIRNLSL